MITVNTVAGLASARPGNGDIVRTRGYSVVGTGENEYRYDRTSSATIDNVFVINGPGGRGRYIATNQEVVDVTQAGAIGDGATDDSVALQRAVDALPVAGGVLSFPQRTYIADNVAAAGTMLFSGMSNFKVIGHGATIKAKNAMVYENGAVLLYFEDCSDFSVDGLTVDANRANRSPVVPELFAHSIVIANCDRFTFNSVRSVNAVTDGFYLSPTDNNDASTYPRNGVFLNCSADNCFRQGMSISGGFDIEVNGGSWTNSNGANPEAGLDLEADVTQVGGAAVSRNVVWKNLYVAGNNGTGLQISDQQHESVLIDNCEITDNGSSAILLGGNTSVRNCNIHSFTTATGNGIVDVYSSAWGKNIIIEGNTFSDISVAKPCVHTHGASPGGVRILSNTAENVHSFGVFFGRGTTVIGNRVRQDTTLTPIYTIAASGNDQHYEANTFQDFLTRCIYQEGERNKYLHNTFLNIYDDTDVPAGPVPIATIDAVTGSCRIDGNVFHNDVAKTTIAVLGNAASTIELSNSTVTNYAVDWVDENGGTFVTGAAAFSKVVVPGQSDIDAGATLNINSGDGIALTTDAGTDTLTVGLWNLNITHTESIGVLNQKSFFVRNAADDGNAAILSATAGNNVVLQSLTTDSGLQLSAAGANGLIQLITDGVVQATVSAGGIDLAAGNAFSVNGTPVGGATNTFTTIQVATQTDVVADSASDTLTLVGAGGITITTDAGTDTITFTGSGGGVSDGDKGDITVSASGATWTIDSGVVTYAKMQDVSATSRILGRITTGAGDVEELTAANVRTIINVEAGADVTDATNVEAAGAVMVADTSTAGYGFVIDEDNMVSDSATKVPTQQSVKAYVDAEVAGASGGGNFPLTTLTVDDTTPDVSSGNFFSTANTVATAITNLDGGTEGDYKEIHVNDANTSFVANSNMALQGGANIPASSSPYVVAFRLEGTQWKQLAPYMSQGHQFATSADGSNNLTLQNTATNADIVIQADGTGVVNIVAADLQLNGTPVGGGGGISDGDKGDITVSASGATWTIDAGVVTYAKMQDVSATSRILGRITTGAGDVEELTAANVRTIINVEDGADVTDATNVEAAGAVMVADTATTGYGFVVDEDDMVSDSATKVPTQQSVKAYVDANSGGGGLPAGGTVGDLVVNTGSGTGSWSSVASVGANGVTITGGTVVNPATPLAITQTWNDAADTFQAVDITVTDTASAAGSMPLRIRGGAAGSTALFSVNAAGVATVPDGSSSAPSLQIGAGGGFAAASTSGVALVVGGSTQQTFTSTGILLRNTNYIGIASGNPFGSSGDVRLSRDAAAQWGIRNGSATTTPQSIAIYGGVGTNATDSYERIRIYGQSSDNFRIHTEDGATAGDPRGLALGTDETDRLIIGAAGHVTIVDANDLVIGTTTGTKIGTATTQKIGFWNATPVVQQVLATGSSTDNVITLLQTLGLCRQS